MTAVLDLWTRSWHCVTGAPATTIVITLCAVTERVQPHPPDTAHSRLAIRGHEGNNLYGDEYTVTLSPVWQWVTVRVRPVYRSAGHTETDCRMRIVCVHKDLISPPNNNSSGLSLSLLPAYAGRIWPQDCPTDIRGAGLSRNLHPHQDAGRCRDARLAADEIYLDWVNELRAHVLAGLNIVLQSEVKPGTIAVSYSNEWMTLE